MAERPSPAFAAGFRLGKLGYPVTDSPYAPGDMSPHARKWREGWTAGNALHRKAVERIEAEEGPFVVTMTCCGTDAGSQEFASWDEADAFRRQYERPSGHDRVAIVRNKASNNTTPGPADAGSETVVSGRDAGAPNGSTHSDGGAE